VGAPDFPLSERDFPAGDEVRLEQFHRPRDPNHVRDRVERPNLVEVDLFGRDAVHPPLGLGEEPEGL